MLKFVCLIDDLITFFGNSQHVIHVLRYFPGHWRCRVNGVQHCWAREWEGGWEGGWTHVQVRMLFDHKAQLWSTTWVSNRIFPRHLSSLLIGQTETEHKKIQLWGVDVEFWRPCLEVKSKLKELHFNPRDSLKLFLLQADNKKSLHSEDSRGVD